MARRPVFVPDSDKLYVSEVSLDFEQFSGSSIQQKQRSIASLHASYVARFPSSRVLEVSSKSERDLGVQLSAFNLMIEHPERGSYSVECARHDKLVEQVMMFDAFTDIEHNPERSINCQARSVAKVVGLARAGLLADALQSPRAFLELGYH